MFRLFPALKWAINLNFRVSGRVPDPDLEIRGGGGGGGRLSRPLDNGEPGLSKKIFFAPLGLSLV